MMNNNMKFWVVKAKNENLYLFSSYDSGLNHQYVLSNNIKALEESRSNYSWNKEDAEAKMKMFQPIFDIKLEVVCVTKKNIICNKLIISLDK